MASLSGQTIQSTYQGMLKLADSTTGITSNLQPIQDGLGNDTGLRIKQDQLEVPNILGFRKKQARYYGSGYNQVTPSQYASGTQNIIQAVPFYDSGEYSYSAITINVHTQTSTSDTLEMALYTSQMINPYGLFPYEPIISGMTVSITSTGLKTYVFPSQISMSGFGGDLYFMVFKISNSGVQPTFRPYAATPATNAGILSLSYGYSQSLQNAYNQPFRLNTNSMVFSGLTTFDTPYSNTIDTTQSTTLNIAGSALGFILHTVGG